MSAATTDTPNDGEVTVQGGSPACSEDLRFGDFEPPESKSPGSSATFDSNSPPFLLKLSEVLPFPDTEEASPKQNAASPEQSTVSEGSRAGAELLKCLKAEPIK